MRQFVITETLELIEAHQEIASLHKKIAALLDEKAVRLGLQPTIDGQRYWVHEAALVREDASVDYSSRPEYTCVTRIV